MMIKNLQELDIKDLTWRQKLFGHKQQVDNVYADKTANSLRELVITFMDLPMKVQFQTMTPFRPIMVMNQLVSTVRERICNLIIEADTLEKMRGLFRGLHQHILGSMKDVVLKAREMRDNNFLGVFPNAVPIVARQAAMMPTELEADVAKQTLELFLSCYNLCYPETNLQVP